MNEWTSVNEKLPELRMVWIRLEDKIPKEE
jgi:hypothetical protein